MTATQRESAESIATLRALLPPGGTVWTILRHVSRSGMLRVIDPIILSPRYTDGDPEPISIGWHVARATRTPFDPDRYGLRVGGAGMDMGFHVVYTLSSVLYPDGFDCIGRDCPSNAHSNGEPRFDPTPDADGFMMGRSHHTDGGYALTHRWL